MEGSSCIGLTLNWNHKKSEANCSMPCYLPRSLKDYCMFYQTNKKDSPYLAPHVTHGQKTQFALEEENLPILEKDIITLT